MAQLVDGSDTGIGTKLTITPAPANSAAIMMYNNEGRVVAHQSKATYVASASFTPAAAPTEVFTITGSPTKIIRVVSLYWTSSNTLGGASVKPALWKRGSPDLGGVFVTATAVPLDSLDVAATATVGHFTTTPTTIGAPIGTCHYVHVPVAATAPTAFAAGIEEAGQEMIGWSSVSYMDKLLTLNNVNESLSVAFEGDVLLTGQTHAYRVVWIEETT